MEFSQVRQLNMGVVPFRTGTDNTGGYLYAISASSGRVKIGCSSTVRRLDVHVRNIESWGLEVTDQWVSGHHMGYQESERDWIAWAKLHCVAIYGNEYFEDANWKHLVRHGSFLSFKYR